MLEDEWSFSKQMNISDLVQKNLQKREFENFQIPIWLGKLKSYRKHIFNCNIF